jgi:hypothetical protein
MADIIGLDKINQWLENKQFFQRIELYNAKSNIIDLRAKEGETKEDLINQFNEIVESFDLTAPDNFKNYTLRVSGSYKENASKLTPLPPVLISFNKKELSTVGGYFQKKEPAPVGQQIDFNYVLGLVTDLERERAARMKAEQDLNDFLMEEEEPEMGAVQPTIQEALTSSFIGKLDTIIDVVLTRFMTPNNTIQKQSYAINGINDIENIIAEFKTINPDIESDLAKLLQLAKDKPALFNMLIQQLRTL